MAALIKAKPFLKWAGGKGQIIGEIQKMYPFPDGSITKYAEPFVGGGSVLFDVLGKYELDDVYISDINKELITTYVAVKNNLADVVSRLKSMQSEYLSLNNEDRKAYYYNKRRSFNDNKTMDTSAGSAEIAALMIFLNRTCFNGLYRVNSKGEFNVPMGSYKNPRICDEENLAAVSESLKNVKIVCGDYKLSGDFIDEHTFVYFDPPYRPLNSTSSFTAYSEAEFGDKQQAELADFVFEVSKRGAKVALSNSDPKNENESDNFFERLYSGLSIKRIYANRMINSKAAERGKISELIISNF